VTDRGISQLLLQTLFPDKGNEMWCPSSHSTELPTEMAGTLSWLFSTNINEWMQASSFYMSGGVTIIDLKC